MKKWTTLLALFSLVFLLSCGEEKELTEKEKIAKLPINERVSVEAINAKIAQFKELQKRIDEVANREDLNADQELFSDFPAAAVEIQLQGSLRDQWNQLEGRILDLERQKQAIFKEAFGE